MDNLPTQPDENDASDPIAEPPTNREFIGNASINKEEDRKRRKAQCRRKLRKAPPYIEATCAILLVFITGFYTFYAARQANAAKKAAMAAQGANDVARDALVRSNRPWLTDEGSPKLTFKMLPNDTVAGNLVFPVRNLGPSPALEVGVGAIPFIRRSGDDSDFVSARKESCQWAETNARVSGDSLFPQQAKRYDAILLKAVPDFGSRVTRFLISGCIAYRDQFDTTRTTHHTSFCVMGNISRPDLLYNCNNGEIAD